MIQVQFFARYREVLDCSEQSLPWDDELRTLADVRDRLLIRGEAWQVLAEAKIMCARNQQLCALETEVTDGDEIAFFPPVTGG